MECVGLIQHNKVPGIFNQAQSAIRGLRVLFVVDIKLLFALYSAQGIKWGIPGNQYQKRNGNAGQIIAQVGAH